MGTNSTTVQIERVEENGKRFYQGVVKDKTLKGTSVTTIISAFEDKSWLERWWYSLGKSLADTDEEILRLGKIMAAEVSNEAASHGTAQHEQAEFMLLGMSEYDTTSLPTNLRVFLEENITPTKHDKFPKGLGCEVPILYEKYDNVVGGTTDLVCDLRLDNLYFHDTKQKLSDVYGTDMIRCVGDYKFPKKPKYEKDNIRYYLQLPAYRAGLQYSYDLEVDFGLLIIAPRSTEMLYLWLLEKKALDYYYKVFDEMLYLHAGDNHELFSWNYFVEKALKEDGANAKRIVHKKKVYEQV
jgi:hypothetical protein